MDEPSALPESEVREALERVLASTAFARSKRMSAFLRFVVEETLGGRGNRLKAVTIAQAVYGRDETFDPREDALISVQAGRLRGRLKQYYETVGRDDPVLISIPKGTYTPAFTWKQTGLPGAEPHASEPTNERRGRFNRRGVLTVGVVLSAVLILAVWQLFGTDRDKITNQSSAPQQTSNSVSIPFIAVLPFVTNSDDPLEQRLAKGLAEGIITNLTKLSRLSVMAHASMLELENDIPSIKALRQQFGATHILRGSLQQTAGTIRISVQLIDTNSKVTIWGDQLDSPISDFFNLQDKLANRVTAALSVQVNPDERNRFLHRHTSVPEALVLYRQGLVLILPPNDMTRILTARQLFHRVTELDPKFAGGFAGEGFTHVVAALFAKATMPQVELDRGISLAKKAIEKDPSFGMGYATLALAYGLSGRVDEGLANAQRAIAVQPGDAFAQFVVGMNLVLSGKPDEAHEPLLEALRLDPAEPRTPYMNVLGIVYYVTGQYSLALDILDRNDERGGPSGPHMLLIRAAAYAQLGKQDKARAVVAEFRRMHADFPARKWLAQWLGAADQLTNTMHLLYRLGLPEDP